MTDPALIPMSGGCYRVENGELVPDLEAAPPTATPEPAPSAPEKQP